MVGSGTVSANTAHGTCAWSSSAVARSRMPLPAMYGSVTISGRERPSRANRLGNSANAPPPIDISRGAVISAAILCLRSRRLLQQEPQHAARLLAGFEQRAAGGLTEMLEIL